MFYFRKLVNVSGQSGPSSGSAVIRNNR